ncbi:SDR family oxidoreductase [soil metagenome]
MAHVLVTGATGYIGGRLVPELLDAGHRVRCVARAPGKLDGRSWRDAVEVVEGDVTDEGSLRRAMDGVDAAYFLVHSMGGSADFAARDREAAEAFGTAADAAGVGQLIYLGGLGDPGDPELSEHLRSRHEVGRALAEGPVPVTELRAAVIIGSGSASFEMLRNLVEILPVMTTPKWVRTRCQPVAIRDILFYLVAVLGNEDAKGQALEVGGPDVLTYQAMMQTFAEVARLQKRLVIPVPVLTPNLSSLWVGLVTPLPTGLARPLVASLTNEVVVTDRPISAVIEHESLTFRQSLDLALRRVEHLDVSTSWAGAGLPGRTAADPLSSDPDWSGGTVLCDEQEATADAPAEDLFAVVSGIGGKRGWYVTNWLWGVRGLVDAILGGVGMRRGRRHPNELRVGDALDFWRVETYEPPELLRLRAEMRLPGRAWLEWRVEPDASGSKLSQRALFFPRGLFGRLYWYAMLPFHAIIFKRLATRLAHAAETRRQHGEDAAQAEVERSA